MANEEAINQTADKGLDFQAIATDIAALKRDLSTLLRSMKDNAMNDVGHLGEEAVQGYHTVAAQGERAIKAVGHQVEERPLLSLALAFALGFVGSRLLSR